jgi:hypothetical protein
MKCLDIGDPMVCRHEKRDAIRIGFGNRESRDRRCSTRIPREGLQHDRLGVDSDILQLLRDEESMVYAADDAQRLEKMRADSAKRGFLE